MLISDGKLFQLIIPASAKTASSEAAKADTTPAPAYSSSRSSWTLAALGQTASEQEDGSEDNNNNDNDNLRRTERHCWLMII